LRTKAARGLAALLLAGLGLAGCGASTSEFSTTFSNTTSANLDDSQIQLRGTTEGTSAHFLPRMKPFDRDASLLAEVRPAILDPASPLQCVPFAREASGIDIYGDAKYWWRKAAGKYPRTKRPQEGAVLVLKGYRTTRRGHVAVVKQILDERTIVVDHANWGNDGRIYLSAPVRDVSPKNDWSQVKVWYTPAGQWGQRTYRTRGFILPTAAVASVAEAQDLFSGRN
jgi:surface antigen